MASFFLILCWIVGVVDAYVLYLTDLLHLNTRGATMVAGCVADFIGRNGI